MMTIVICLLLAYGVLCAGALRLGLPWPDGVDYLGVLLLAYSVGLTLPMLFYLKDLNGDEKPGEDSPEG